MLPEVIINDVGPRDGLQSQPKILEVKDKVRLIRALLNAGLTSIEVGAFVSPKAVPAMAGTEEVIRSFEPKQQLMFNALIPNMRGYEAASDTAISCSSLVVATSNTMNQKNIRMSTEQSVEVCRQVFARAGSEGKQVQVYVATAWECPFEGRIDADSVLELCHQLKQAGATRLIIADTIGAANPKSVNQLMRALVDEFGTDSLACHFHDTRAMGLANIYAAIDTGIRRFDASIAGLGGCPFAPGASGNVATEDVVMMVEQMGLTTGINMAQLMSAADLAIELTGTAKGGKARPWLQQKMKQQGADYASSGVANEL